MKTLEKVVTRRWGRHSCLPSGGLAAWRGRAGLTFAELMFAVILLGIGFIMLAGAFPVAIQQTRQSFDDANAASMAIEAAHYMAAIADDATFVDTNGTLQPVPTGPRDYIGGFDTRLGWVPLYRRNKYDRFTQVFIFAAKMRNASAFTADDLTGGTPNLSPTAVNVTLNQSAQTITFNSVARGQATEGAWVVLSSGANSGRFYRVGNLTTGTTFQLVPGNDMLTAAESGTYDGYILGQGLSDGKYMGEPMETAIFSTYVYFR